MPDNAALDAALAALAQAFNDGIDKVETAITAEIAEIKTILENAGVSQATIDKVNAITVGIANRLAAVQQEVNDEVTPPPPPAPIP